MYVKCKKISGGVIVMYIKASARAVAPLSPIKFPPRLSPRDNVCKVELALLKKIKYSHDNAPLWIRKSRMMCKYSLVYAANQTQTQLDKAHYQSKKSGGVTKLHTKCINTKKKKWVA
jgi:hypothetical protein